MGLLEQEDLMGWGRGQGLGGRVRGAVWSRGLCPCVWRCRGAVSVGLVLGGAVSVCLAGRGGRVRVSGCAGGPCPWVWRSEGPCPWVWRCGGAVSVGLAVLGGPCPWVWAVAGAAGGRRLQPRALPPGGSAGPRPLPAARGQRRRR